MHARILSASLCLLCAAAVPAAGQYTGDKKADAAPAKAPPKITADTPINGKTLDQWIALISGKDRSLTELALQAIVAYPPNISKKALPDLIEELKKHTSLKPIDMSVRTNIPIPLAAILASQEKPDAKQVEETVAVLRKMGQDPQAIVKLRAVQALGQMGPLAKDAIPDLVRTLNDPLSQSWELRHAAVTSLGTTAFDPKGAAPPQNVVDALLKHGLHDPALKVRLATINSLDMLKVRDAAGFKKQLQTELQHMSEKDPDPLCKMCAHLAIYLVLATTAEKKKRAGFGRRIPRQCRSLASHRSCPGHRPNGRKGTGSQGPAAAPAQIGERDEGQGSRGHGVVGMGAGQNGQGRRAGAEGSQGHGRRRDNPRGFPQDNQRSH